MKTVPRSVLLLAVVFSFLLSANLPFVSAHKIDQRSQQSTSQEYGSFVAAYDHCRDPYNEMARKQFQSLGILEGLCENINGQFYLPTDINIVLTECGQANALYNPRTHSIHICWELFSVLLDLFRPYFRNQAELNQNAANALIFIIFHEIGHALIHVYDLPTTGREEDAVDQFSTVWMYRLGGGDQIIRSADFFYLSEKNRGPFSKTPFWDEHSLDLQRFYNIICLIYGTNPQRYANFIRLGTLPVERARRCQQEFTQIDRAWYRLLQPHAKPGSAFSRP
jgi:hypothetical protein